MKLTLGKKLGLGFAVVLVMMVGSALLTYLRISEIRRQEAAILDVRFPLSVDCYELLTNLELTQTRARDAILGAGDKTRTDTARQDWGKRWEQVELQMSKLQELKASFVRPEDRERVDKVSGALPSLMETQSHLFRSAEDGSAAGVRQAREILYTSSKPQNDAIKKTLHDIQDSAAELNAEAGKTLRADSFSVILTLGISSIFAVACAIVIAVFISSSVSSATKAVLRQAEAIANNDLRGEELKVVSEDELGDLTRAINKMHSNLRAIIESIAQTSQNVANASEEFSAVSQQISANSEETSAQANAVSSATEQVNRGLQTVASATEEMSASIKDISKNATEAAKVADGAMRTATETNTVVAKLGGSSAEIGQVIKVITSIAQKTDLLALNATVEAARAGEVGAGFAVVANEVKELAKQTATATEDISRKIETIQADAKSAVQAIASIAGVIGQVNDISGTIATAVVEQSATSSEMARNISEAAKGSGEVAQNIQGVAQAAQSTSQGATDSQKAAKSLAEMSTHLRELVGRFKLEDAVRTTAGEQSRNSWAPSRANKVSHLEEEFVAR